VAEAEAHVVMHEGGGERLMGFAKLRLRSDHDVSEQQ
jgi:hypothetical protein